MNARTHMCARGQAKRLWQGKQADCVTAASRSTRSPQHDVHTARKRLGSISLWPTYVPHDALRWHATYHRLGADGPAVQRSAICAAEMAKAQIVATLEALRDSDGIEKRIEVLVVPMGSHGRVAPRPRILCYAT
jgi:hypothetical protein